MQQLGLSEEFADDLLKDLDGPEIVPDKKTSQNPKVSSSSGYSVTGTNSLNGYPNTVDDAGLRSSGSKSATCEAAKKVMRGPPNSPIVRSRRNGLKSKNLKLLVSSGSGSSSNSDCNKSQKVATASQLEKVEFLSGDSAVVQDNGGVVMRNLGVLSKPEASAQVGLQRTLSWYYSFTSNCVYF